MAELTPLQERFCLEYIKDLNATAAARRAGSKSKDPRSVGAQWLGKPHIQARIAQLKAERAEELKIDAAWVLRRLVEEVQADISDILDAGGHVLPVCDWPDVWRRGLVQGFKAEEIFVGKGKTRMKTGRMLEVKISDRLRRLELIGKHIDVNAFREQLGVGGPDGGPVEVEDVRAELSRRIARIAERRSPAKGT